METVTEPPEIRQNKDFPLRSWIMLDVTCSDIIRLTNGLLSGPRHLLVTSLWAHYGLHQRRRDMLHFLVQIRRPCDITGLRQSPESAHFIDATGILLDTFALETATLRRAAEWFMYSIHKGPPSLTLTPLSRLCLVAIISTPVIDSWFTERGYWCNWQQDGAPLWTMICNVSRFCMYPRVNGLFIGMGCHSKDQLF